MTFHIRSLNVSAWLAGLFFFFFQLKKENDPQLFAVSLKCFSGTPGQNSRVCFRSNTTNSSAKTRFGSVAKFYIQFIQVEAE